MANDVFANNMEVSCKAADGKSICAFPDVCFTPPQTPATPPGVPIPYPNTGMASDTTSGSRTVKISKKEVMLKNKSYFKKSTGDEAGSAPKKGVVTSKNMGKVYFIAWSMDVKVEGENVVRNLDLTTHNHASLPGNTAPWPYTDAVAFPAAAKACDQEVAKEKNACSDGSGAYKSADECCKDKKCQKARQCMLVPYGGSGSPNCCKGKTGHHLLPNSLLQESRGDSNSNVPGLKSSYNVNQGACVCVTGESSNSGDHKKLHDKTKEKLRAVMMPPNPQEIDYATAKEKVSEAHSETFPHCRKECTAAQIDASLQTHSKTKPPNPNVRQKDGMTRKNFDRYRDGDAD